MTRDERNAYARRWGKDNRDKTRIIQTRQRRKRRKIIETCKAIPCADCGSSFHHVVMDFDHRPEEDKLFDIGQDGARVGMPSLLNEIAKCDVVCSNCHRIRTWNRLKNAEHKERVQREG